MIRNGDRQDRCDAQNEQEKNPCFNIVASKDRTNARTERGCQGFTAEEKENQGHCRLKKSIIKEKKKSK